MTVRSLRPDQLSDITRKENPDGSGDILFAGRPSGGFAGARSGPFGFLCVADVREVERYIARLAAAAGRI
jgi:hypothetical protein